MAPPMYHRIADDLRDQIEQKADRIEVARSLPAPRHVPHPHVFIPWGHRLGAPVRPSERRSSGARSALPGLELRRSGRRATR